MAKLNVEQYSKTVLDDVNRFAGPVNIARAVSHHSTRVAEEGRAHIRDAAKLAYEAVNQYSELRGKGMDHEQARDRTAKAMDGRFDDQGRATRRSERQRSNALSL